jgi:3-dehydroshikimate dehydratase
VAVHRGGGARLTLMPAAIAAVAFTLALQPLNAVAQQSLPRVLRVDRLVDDASAGTLRWAIEASNATPERERIALDFAGRAPHVITLQRALPPVKGPVEIEGAAWKRTGEYVVIDGAGYVPQRGPEGCPGATPGQYGANVRTMSYPGLQIIDTDDVEIAGVEIRRFCIGVLINRSTRVVIRDSRIVDNRGGAGVMLTGDDGRGNATSTTTIHNKVLRTEFIDNGDGLELTRGAAFNLVANNVFRSTAANPEPAQGIEILRGHDNVVSGNRFEGYSDGVQVNWGDRNYIVANTVSGNTFGLNLTGVGTVVDGNIIRGNRIGIVVRPADPSPIVRLTRNRITGNGRDELRCEAGGTCDPSAPKGATAFGLPGLEHAGFVGSRGKGVVPTTLQYICPEQAPRCHAAPNAGLRPPTLTEARAVDGDVSVAGAISGAAHSRYVVELFGNTDVSREEAEVFLGDRAVYTDATGAAVFNMRVQAAPLDPPIRSVTATVTSAAGATSSVSRARNVAGPVTANRGPRH